MTEHLQELLREALLNNTYDHSSTDAALKMAWENSFSYLYRMQEEKIGYDEYHYYSNDTTAKNPVTIGHFYLDGYIRACFDIDKDIIHVCERKEFRLSKFYHQYFTLQDMRENEEIFHWIPIVIIDDQVVWDWDMKVISKDAVQFRMPKPFRRQFVLKNERDPDTDEIIYVDHKVQVMVVQNIYYERLVLNKMHLYMNRSEKSITVKKEMLTKSLLPSEAKEGIYFLTISFPSDGDMASYLCTQLLDCQETETDLKAYISDEIFDKLERTVKEFWVSVVFVNELHRKTWYNGSTTVKVEGANEADLMVINRTEDFVPYASPIPIKNFVVFRKETTESGYTLQKNEDMIQLYYPNIYRIVDPDRKYQDEYKVFYFYHYNTYLKYTCVHDFWFRYLKMHFSYVKKDLSLEELLNMVWRGTVEYPDWTEEQVADFTQTFMALLNYMPKAYQYAETDFIYNWCNLSSPQDLGELSGKPFQYKEERLKEWIREDPWLLRDYVLEQKKVGASYHLFTNSIDLSSRLRTNTNTELHYDYEFQQPMYVFAMRNEREYPVLMDIRFFVDGIFVENMFQDRYLFMDYLYIPADMVTNDSYLEIEVLPRYDVKEPIRFTSMEDSKEITIVEPEESDIWPTAADAYMMQKSGQDDEYTHLYENSLNDFFEVKSCYSEGEWIVQTEDPEKPVCFTRLRHFKLTPTDPLILNKDLEFCINKHPIGLRYRIPTAGYPYLKLVGAENKFKYHPDYIRVFRNGRLLPNVKWTFYGTFECPRIQLLEWFEAGDTIFFDITPFRYKLIYYQEELEPKQTLIDLKEIITKPFDWRYYDVYMNGRKLSMNNLFSIMPWAMTMVNLKSNYNLAIYEKERDWEYYGLNYKEPIYFFSPEDLFSKSWVSEEEKNNIIKAIIDTEKDDRLNIYPNTNEEEKQDWEDNRKYVLIMAFYLNELLPKSFVNPDVLQFNKAIISEVYPEIYNRYVRPGSEEYRNSYEKEERSALPERMMLDPDIYVNGENEEDLTYVYMVGHPEEVSDEILKETVTINDTDYKIGGDN